jgi:hypothetical protein
MGQLEAHPPTPAAATPAARPSNGTPKTAPKKKAKEKAATKAKDADNGKLDLTDADAQKSYQTAIVKFLRAGKHVDEETAINSKGIRDVIGGSPDQARAHLNLLIEAKSVAYCGRARGTKYFLA